MRARFFLSVLALVLSVFFVSCTDKYPVAFLLQADETEPDSMTVPFPLPDGKTVKFLKAGMIGTRDIESYQFIRTEPGVPPEGVYFLLTPGATNRYTALYIQNYGKLVLPVANGIPRQVYRIGKTAPPGAVPVFSGLGKEDLALIKKVYEPSKKEKELEEGRQAKAKERIEKIQ